MRPIKPGTVLGCECNAKASHETWCPAYEPPSGAQATSLWPSDLTICQNCKRDMLKAPHTVDWVGKIVCLPEGAKVISPWRQQSVSDSKATSGTALGIGKEIAVDYELHCEAIEGPDSDLLAQRIAQAIEERERAAEEALYFELEACLRTRFINDAALQGQVKAHDLLQEVFTICKRDKGALARVEQAAREAEREQCYLRARGTKNLKSHGNSQMYWKGRADAASDVRTLKVQEINIGDNHISSDV